MCAAPCTAPHTLRSKQTDRQAGKQPAFEQARKQPNTSLCTVQVVSVKAEPGSSVAFADLKAAVETHKPAVLFLVQVWPQGVAVHSLKI